eukprot:scaffold8227_cov119-Isochrysis_galbana.AAC.12
MRLMTSANALRLKSHRSPHPSTCVWTVVGISAGISRGAQILAPALPHASAAAFASLSLLLRRSEAQRQQLRHRQWHEPLAEPKHLPSLTRPLCTLLAHHPHCDGASSMPAASIRVPASGGHVVPCARPSMSAIQATTHASPLSRPGKTLLDPGLLSHPRPRESHLHLELGLRSRVVPLPELPPPPALAAGRPAAARARQSAPRRPASWRGRGSQLAERPPRRDLRRGCNRVRPLHVLEQRLALVSPRPARRLVLRLRRPQHHQLLPSLHQLGRQTGRPLGLVRLSLLQLVRPGGDGGQLRGQLGVPDRQPLHLGPQVEHQGLGPAGNVGRFPPVLPSQLLLLRQQLLNLRGRALVLLAGVSKLGPERRHRPVRLGLGQPRLLRVLVLARRQLGSCARRLLLALVSGRQQPPALAAERRRLLLVPARLPDQAVDARLRCQLGLRVRLGRGLELRRGSPPGALRTVPLLFGRPEPRRHLIHRSGGRTLA